MDNRNKQILNIALPAIVSNITVPLLGLVDVAIVGHLGAAAYIGAIAVGGMTFNVVYWIFGFLRMGTSGMTSQALGRRDLGETARMLVRSVGIAFAVAFALIALQIPLREASLAIMQPTEEVARLTTVYFNILIWGAPAMLGLFSLSGWFIGMQNSRTPMLIAIVQNVVNIAASTLLVFGDVPEGLRTLARPLLLAGRVAARGHVTLLQRQPRHIPTHALHGGRDAVFHVSRLAPGRGRAGRQHAAHAVLPAVFIRDGRLRLCRRGVERPLLRRAQRRGTA